MCSVKGEVVVEEIPVDVLVLSGVVDLAESELESIGGSETSLIEFG